MWLVVLFSPTCHGEDMLQTARQKLREYAETLRTISGTHIVQKHVVPGATRRRNPASKEQIRLEGEVKIDLARGAFARREVESWVYPDVSPQPFRLRRYVTFDGRVSTSLVSTFLDCPLESDLERDRPYLLIRQRGSRLEVGDNISRWAGLRIHPYGITLAEALSSQMAGYVGPVDISGVPCRKFLAEIGDVELEADLDPQLDFLPRRLELRRTDTPEKPYYVLETLEYRRFPDRAGGERYFPSHGTLRNSEHLWTEVKLVDGRLNEELTIADFQIDEETLPPGVRIDMGGQPSRFTQDDPETFARLDRGVDAVSEQISAAWEKVQVSTGPIVPGAASPPVDNDRHASVLVILGGLAGIALLWRVLR